MRVAIMQPTYLPWMGALDLRDQVDAYVFLDTVQFDKRSWQQRNRIKTPKGLEWLSVPARVSGRFDQSIRHVEVADPAFAEKHARTIEQNYARADAFEAHWPGLDELLRGKPWANLADLDVATSEWLAREIGVESPALRASELSAEGSRSALLASICAELGADEYLSPQGSAGYLLEELGEFESRGISVLFHAYEHPEYRQLHGEFEPYASALDLLLNEGGRSLELVRSGRRPPLRPDELAAG